MNKGIHEVISTGLAVVVLIVVMVLVLSNANISDDTLDESQEATVSASLSTTETEENKAQDTTVHATKVDNKLQKTKKVAVKNKNMQEVQPISNTGVISGSLTYPSGRIPSGMQACASNVSNGEVKCTSSQSGDFIYGIGYSLELNAGNYLVYAQIDGEKTYYNSYMKAFAQSGEWPDYNNMKCSSYEAATISVAVGETSSDIALGDWYFNTACQ